MRDDRDDQAQCRQLGNGEHRDAVADEEESDQRIGLRGGAMSIDHPDEGPQVEHLSDRQGEDRKDHVEIVARSARGRSPRWRRDVRCA